MPFEDGGPPILLDTTAAFGGEPVGAPQAAGVDPGEGGVAGGPVPLGDPEQFPFWAIF